MMDNTKVLKALTYLSHETWLQMLVPHGTTWQEISAYHITHVFWLSMSKDQVFRACFRLAWTHLLTIQHRCFCWCQSIHVWYVPHMLVDKTLSISCNCFWNLGRQNQPLEGALTEISISFLVWITVDYHMRLPVLENECTQYSLSWL